MMARSHESQQRITRLFWDWSRPVLEWAVEFLSREWQPPTPLDLSDTVIVVPTSEAGRRLREALARCAGDHESAALAPWVWHPEQALMSDADRRVVASRMQSLLAWRQALDQTALRELKHLFPNLPAQITWGWQIETARTLMELRTMAGAGGLAFADVAESPAVQRDRARWLDLARLEIVYLEQLAAINRRDAQCLKRERAQNPQLPEGVRRIVVAAAPDLPPLMDRWLHACAALGTEVVVAVHAPPASANQFEVFGRPALAGWGEDAGSHLPLRHDQILLCHDPSRQAHEAVEWLRQQAPQGRVAAGVCDPETGAQLREKLESEGVAIFEPGGASVRNEGVWHVLQCCRAMVATGSWKAFATLLRIPDMRCVLAGREVSAAVLLESLDDFTARHLPVTLGHGCEILSSRTVTQADGDQEGLSPASDTAPHLPSVIEAGMGLVEAFSRLSFDKAARQLVLRLYGGQEFRPEQPGDSERIGLISDWLRICDEMQSETGRFGIEADGADLFAWSLELLGEGSLSEPRGEVDLVLQGWLELPWEQAPNLIVMGVNEEHVPGILIGHPFLPDQVREQLGLPCQKRRFARDAFILNGLAAQRSAKGSLKVMCGQWSENGDSLRPSRLLFLCEDAELPRRVSLLFPKEESTGTTPPEPPATLAWRLRPRAERPRLETVSPSRLGAYLRCPFRFYLSSVLRMESVDSAKRELAANEFGDLIHHAFEALAKEPKIRASTDEHEISRFLEQVVCARAHALHGKRLPPLLALQLDGAIQRLRAAASCEAVERQAGWRILEAERYIGGKDDPHPLIIEGVRLTGKIDRIERHEGSGQLRIIDFKTSDRAKSPSEAHYRSVKANSRVDEADKWRLFDPPDGHCAMWIDLQLPLYAAALTAHGLRPQAVAYFCLPRSVQDTRIHEWKDFSEAWSSAALEMAAEVVRRMRRGVFWPPARKSVDGSFDEIFLHDLAAAADPELLLAAENGGAA